MTVRMQEAEAAQDFRRFLAHLKAGNQVQLEHEGSATGIVSLEERKPEDRPGHIDFIVRKLRELEEQHGPLVVEAGYTEQMRKAHDEFNQPLELRTSWD